MPSGLPWAARLLIISVCAAWSFWIRAAAFKYSLISARL